MGIEKTVRIIRLNKVNSQCKDSNKFCKQMDVLQLQYGIEQTALWDSFIVQRMLVDAGNLNIDTMFGGIYAVKAEILILKSSNLHSPPRYRVSQKIVPRLYGHCGGAVYSVTSVFTQSTSLIPCLSQSNTWLLIKGREKAKFVVASKHHFCFSQAMSK